MKFPHAPRHTTFVQTTGEETRLKCIPARKTAIKCRFDGRFVALFKPLACVAEGDEKTILLHSAHENNARAAVAADEWHESLTDDKLPSMFNLPSMSTLVQ